MKGENVRAAASREAVCQSDATLPIPPAALEGEAWTPLRLGEPRSGETSPHLADSAGQGGHPSPVSSAAQQGLCALCPCPTPRGTTLYTEAKMSFQKAGLMS